MTEDSDTQKSGYLDVKQSSKVKGRKLKSWKKRWVVVKKMTDLAAGTQSARVDLYPYDPASRQGQGQNQTADRVTFVLDQLCAVQTASSKTHPFAFELVELEPVLVLSGASRELSDAWIASLRRMFFADDAVKDTESFKVTIQANKDSLRFELSGDYTLSVSPEGVSLRARTSTRLSMAKKILTMDNPCHDALAHKRSSSYEGDKAATTPKGSVHAGKRRGKCGGGEEEEGEEEEEEKDLVSWRLSMLKRFDVEKISAQQFVFLFDCGPNSPTGEATFRFITDEAYQVLASFRRCISMAMERRKRLDRFASTPDLRPPRTRAISTVTGYQTLLESSAREGAPAENGHCAQGNGSVFKRLSSASSSSTTTTPASPTSSTAEFVTSGGSPKNEAKEKGGLPMLPPRHRISVVSMPAGILSSSPRSSDTFGNHTVSGFPNSSPESRSQFGSFMLQQQQPQLNDSWPMQQQVSRWPQQPATPTSFPAVFSPPPVLGFPQPSLRSENHVQQQQQLQLWLQQQQEHSLAKFGASPAEGGGGMRRNSSVPNLISLASDTTGLDKGDSEATLRRRTSSVSVERQCATGSICSTDSGVVTDAANPRKGSNSFGSSVSTESSRSIRKTSEGAGPAKETSPNGGAVKARTTSPLPEEAGATSSDTASHIYQDLDSVKAEGYLASRRRSSFAFELGRRRHSTGDVSHNDYEELDAVKKTVAAVAAAEAGGASPADLPPELPARPPFFGQAKALLPGRKRGATTRSLFHDLRSFSFRDLKRGESISQETLTSSKHRDGSSDIYETIKDFDGKTFRRSSSDITPISSYLDLRFPERPLNPRPKQGPSGSGGLSGEGSDGVLCAEGADGKPAPSPLNLLSFSEVDVSQAGVEPCGKRSIKTAPLDFFLDDASFHSNPMVTGELKTGDSSKPLAPGVSSPCWQDPPVFPGQSHSASEGWADFSQFSPEPFSPVASQSSSDPFWESSCWAQAGLSGESPAGKGAGRVEPVYIDMRRQEAVEESAACEYVTSEAVNRDQAVLDFLLFQ